MRPRHIAQAAAIVGNIHDAGLLMHGSNNGSGGHTPLFVEMGAGRGQLSAMVAACRDATHQPTRMLLIDREASRRKADGAVRYTGGILGKLMEGGGVVPSAVATTTASGGAASAASSAVGAPSISGSSVASEDVQLARVRIDLADFDLSGHPAAFGVASLGALVHAAAPNAVAAAAARGGVGVDVHCARKASKRQRRNESQAARASAALPPNDIVAAAQAEGVDEADEASPAAGAADTVDSVLRIGSGATDVPVLDGSGSSSAAGRGKRPRPPSMSALSSFADSSGSICAAANAADGGAAETAEGDREFSPADTAADTLASSPSALSSSTTHVSSSTAAAAAAAAAASAASAAAASAASGGGISAAGGTGKSGKGSGGTRGAPFCPPPLAPSVISSLPEALTVWVNADGHAHTSKQMSEVDLRSRLALAGIPVSVVDAVLAAHAKRVDGGGAAGPLDLPITAATTSTPPVAVVAIGKHLCGAATDLALKCLANSLRRGGVARTAPASSSVSVGAASAATGIVPATPIETGGAAASVPVVAAAVDVTGGEAAAASPPVAAAAALRGIAIATCCHQLCSWEHYVGRAFFRDVLVGGG